MKSEIIKKLEAHIASECTEIDVDEQYDSMLNECHPAPTVACCTIDAGAFLKEHDPVAYRCGKNDWLNSQRECWSEVNGSYYDQQDVAKAKEEFLDNLNDELGEAQNNDDDDEIKLREGQIAEVENWEPS